MHRVEGRVARAFDDVDDHLPLRRDERAVEQNVRGYEVDEIVEYHDVGAPARGDESEIGALQPVRGVVGGATQREHRIETVCDEPAQEVIDTAVGEEREREQVVGCGHEVRRCEREALHLGDDLGQDLVDHPAQFHRHAVAQTLEAIGFGEDLVVGGHPRREVRLQDRTGEPGRVPRHELAALEPGGDDVHHAVGAAEHADHVHNLRQPADLVPGEHLGDLGPVQVGARELEAGLGRNARRRLHDEPDRQPPTRLDRIANPRDAGDVRELVRVDEHRGGTARAHRFRVAAGREHRRLEVHVHVDEARREEAPAAVDRVERIGARTTRVNAGDERADDADVGGALLTTSDVDDRPAGQQEIERFPPLRGRYGTGADRGVDSIDVHEILRSSVVGRQSSEATSSANMRRSSMVMRSAFTCTSAVGSSGSRRSR